MSDDIDEGLRQMVVNPRVTSRGPSSSPECLSLRIRLWPDDGATNEMKILALFPSLSGDENMSSTPASVKIYVEKGSNLCRISSANVIKSLLVDLINKDSRGMGGRY